MLEMPPQGGGVGGRRAHNVLNAVWDALEVQCLGPFQMKHRNQMKRTIPKTDTQKAYSQKLIHDSE